MSCMYCLLLDNLSYLSTSYYFCFFQLDLLDHIDSVQKGERDGDILAITARARRVLQDNFSAGYYQDFPIEDRRAKEAVFKVKKKRVGHSGGRGGVNAPRRRGQPNGLGGVQGDDEGDGDVHDEGILHLDDEGGDFMQNSETLAHIQEDEAERNHNAVSYHSSHLSPPHEQADIDPIPPLSHPTLTQSSPQPPMQPLQQLPDEPVQQLTQEPPIQQKRMKL